MHKIFLRETLKIGHSCMNNFVKIINTHNIEVIKKYYDQIDVNNNNNNSNNNSNCKTKIDCPINGLCN